MSAALTTAEKLEGDNVETSIRPQMLADFTGQPQVPEKKRITPFKGKSQPSSNSGGKKSPVVCTARLF